MITRLILFLLPFIAFLIWLWLMGQARKRDGTLDKKAARLLTLGAIATLAGMIVTSYVVVSQRPDRTDGIYIPPHSENGKIVPGKFVDPEDLDRDPPRPADDPGPADDLGPADDNDDPGGSRR